MHQMYWQPHEWTLDSLFSLKINLLIDQSFSIFGSKSIFVNTMSSVSTSGFAQIDGTILFGCLFCWSSRHTRWPLPMFKWLRVHFHNVKCSWFQWKPSSRWRSLEISLICSFNFGNWIYFYFSFHWFEVMLFRHWGNWEICYYKYLCSVQISCEIMYSA